MLGILDYGIGGLSVLAPLVAKHDKVDFVYLADNGATPYGQLSHAALRHRLESLAHYFKSLGVTAILVACNAASSVLSGRHEVFAGVTFYSISPFVLQSVENFPSKNIGIIGGNRTIESRIYETALRQKNRQVRAVATQKLSLLIEAGITSGDEIDTILAAAFKQLDPAGALLLACTHYPALTATIRKIFPKLTVIDPAQTIAADFECPELTKSESGKLLFYCTGDPVKTSTAARSAFALPFETNFEKVT